MIDNDGVIYDGDVIDLNGKRYSVGQFNNTLHIATIIRRCSIGRGWTTSYRNLDSKGATYRAVADRYWSKKVLKEFRK
jgi:hypothetical protein